MQHVDLLSKNKNKNKTELLCKVTSNKLLSGQVFWSLIEQ